MFEYKVVVERNGLKRSQEYKDETREQNISTTETTHKKFKTLIKTNQYK